MTAVLYIQIIQTQPDLPAKLFFCQVDDKGGARQYVPMLTKKGLEKIGLVIAASDRCIEMTNKHRQELGLSQEALYHQGMTVA